MTKKIHGASLYYASDKNIFDALNLHKVDTATVMKLFRRRNIIVGKKTPREDLALYFSRLTHDLLDHKDIAAKIGVAPRRERTTSMDVSGAVEFSDLQNAVDQIKKELEATGDVVQVSREGNTLTINVQYSVVDYKRSEFSQVQVRDGTLVFVKSDEGYIVRNTQNDYLNSVRDTLLGKIEKTIAEPIKKTLVSLFDISSPKYRSKFFHELVNDLPGYLRSDVTEVYVYKAKPELEDEDDDQSDTHVERVLLRGNGVTRSELLNELLDEEDYYITKIGWKAVEKMGVGDQYDIEALFADPKDCTGFSYILSGVYPFENGRVSTKRRAPTKSEVDVVSRVIETKSRELVIKLRAEFLRDVGEGE